MKALEYIEKTRQYLDYLEEHIHNVHQAFLEVRSKCSDMRVIWDDYYYAALEQEVREHDLSKFSMFEFTQYREFFFGFPGERSNINVAWEHHIECNPHHWENWTLNRVGDPNMWEVHCTHMVIDWLAMAYRFKDSPREYYEKNKEKISLPEYGVNFIYQIFERLEKP